MQKKIYDLAKIYAKGLSLGDFLKRYYSEELKKRERKISLEEVQFNKSAMFVALIMKLVELLVKIAIIGDYDTDGILSSAIMKKTFDYLGLESEVILPNRFTNGYGMSKALVDEAIARGCKAIVTVDNGIVAYEACEYAKSKGLTVIITDHHSVGDKLPNADLIINPQLHEDNIKAENICGAFTAFVLCRDLLESVKCNHAFIESLADLAGIATIADVMPLEEENYKIVRYLMSNMHRCVFRNVGLKLLAQQQFIDLSKATAEDLAFSIIPALNATGRMETAQIGFDLVMANSNDLTKLMLLVQKVTILNDYRKKYSRKYSDILLTKVNKDDKINVLLLERTNYDKEDININLEGIIGIMASSIVEDTNKITFVFYEKEDGNLVGSGRNFGGISIIDLVRESVNDGSIKVVKAGGHAGAMGLTIEKSELENFRKVMNSKNINYDEDSTIQKVIKVSPTDDIEELKRELKPFEPFGEGFRKPMFMVETTPSEIFVFNKIHTQMNLKIGGKLEKAIFFFNNKTEAKPSKIYFELAEDYLNIKEIEEIKEGE